MKTPDEIHKAFPRSIATLARLEGTQDKDQQASRCWQFRRVVYLVANSNDAAVIEQANTAVHAAINLYHHARLIESEKKRGIREADHDQGITL